MNLKRTTCTSRPLSCAAKALLPILVLVLCGHTLQAGSATWITTLNNLRAGSQKYGAVTTPVMTPLVDPVTPSAQQDMLFRERAFWMYMTAHRLGDMRRLIRQYGRGAEIVFPTGNYFKGGKYGVDITLVPSQTETNNPNWTACTDRNA